MIAAGEMAVVLLAAGRSTRFGAGDKLLADLDGRPLALHAAAMLAGLGAGQLIAVCPASEGALAQALAAMGYAVVINPEPERGLSSSLACGVTEAARGPARAALVGLADMPFVTPDHIARLMERWDETTAPVAASTNGDAAMPPALFARSLFADLQAVGGDRGGRALLRGAALVEAGAHELVDIDRPGDLPGR